MTRVVFAALATIFITACAFGQSADPNSGDNTPQDRVSGGALRARAPGLIIGQALARHSELIGARVNAARGGGQAGTRPAPETTGGGSSGGLNSGLGSLLDLANQGGLGSLLGGIDLSTFGQGALGGSVGGQPTTGGQTAAGGQNSGGATDGVDPRLQALLDLRDGASSGGATQKSSTRAQSNRAYQYGGGFSRLTKPEDRQRASFDGRSQSITDLLGDLSGLTNDPNNPQSFRSRLIQSWATALFSALTFGFSQDNFQTLIKNVLTPIFLPSANDAAEPDASGDQSTGGDTGGDTGGATGSDTGADAGDDTGGDTGADTGGGIDDLPPPAAENETGSTL